MKTLLGSRVAEFEALPLGARMEVPADKVDSYRRTATKLGLKLSIVERRAGLAVIQRVAETRWGRIKAIVCNLGVGERITIQSSKRITYISCAQRVRVALHVVSESNGLVTLERRERRTYAACKKEGV